MCNIYKTVYPRRNRKGGRKVIKAIYSNPNRNILIHDKNL